MESMNQQKETKTALAHVRQDSEGKWREHLLEEHLLEVARRAGELAKAFGSEDWAKIAGLWHDLGKYSAEFQEYIKKASGYYDAEAHIEEGAPGRVDHSTAGAIHAISSFDKHGRILAYLIAGHHAGLPDWYPSESGGKALSMRLEQPDLLDRVLAQNIPSNLLKQEKPSSPILGNRDGFALWLRMLFSCLVDADFLDTEKFMDKGRSETRKNETTLADMLPIFDHYMNEKAIQAKPTPVTVAEISVRILQHFGNTEIERPSYEKAKYVSLNGLLSSTANETKYDPKKANLVYYRSKHFDVKPNLAGDTMRAILSGSPYPATLLQAAVRRIRAEQEINYPRAALIKACINRSSEKEELKVSLDENNTNPAYWRRNQVRYVMVRHSSNGIYQPPFE